MCVHVRACMCTTAQPAVFCRVCWHHRARYVCLSLSETVSVPLAITEFSWSKQKADVDIGVIAGLLGVYVSRSY